MRIAVQLPAQMWVQGSREGVTHGLATGAERAWGVDAGGRCRAGVLWEAAARRWVEMSTQMYKAVKVSPWSFCELGGGVRETLF